MAEEDFTALTGLPDPSSFLLPYPEEVCRLEGYFDSANHRGLNSEVPTERLNRAIGRLGLERVPITISIEQPSGRVPTLEEDCSYALTTGSSRISVQAETEWGAITALRTLAQLHEQGRIKCCRISDKPKFPWRGLMLDCARRFLSIAGLRETLDLMAYFGLNVLHLHLTDDQGFRFGTKQFPELPSEQHYTKSELTQLVTFASERAIRIVPEIDLPGHCSCWLKARPEWGASKEPVSTTDFGPQRACLDVSNPEVRSSIAALLEEVTQVFPDRYLHIGGDEVMPDWWDQSEPIRQFKRQEGLNTTQELQASFNRYLAEVLSRLGRIPIGWDEVLHPHLPQGFTVQAWRGLDLRNAATQSGRDAIVSSPYYLDLCYPADVHYRYSPETSLEEANRARDQELTDPRLAHVAAGVAWATGPHVVPKLVSSKTQGRVLGGEACMWGEVVSERGLNLRVWSRMPAIAERLWNGVGAQPVKNVYCSMQYHLRRLAEAGYRVESQVLEGLVPQSLWPLVEMLEPVKWYARHLGAERLASRVEEGAEISAPRPYDTRSKLDRVVDFLPPESLASRSCVKDIQTGCELSVWIRGWRSQREHFSQAAALDSTLCALKEASSALAAVADVAEGKRDPGPELAGPFGEFVLPVALAFCSRDD